MSASKPDADELEALEEMARTLTASRAYRVVRRFHRRERYASNPPSNARQGLYVDVETTGLDTANDHIIEIALVPFEFDTNGAVYGVGDPISFLEDPGAPIPAAATELTGINDEMVRGRRIHDERIYEALSKSALVIAHNANFDRKVIERRLPKFADSYWACSQQEVPWEKFGSRGARLDYLLYQVCGEFHGGHRAVDDCLAGLHLLAAAKCDGRSAMSYLLDSARQPSVRIWAIDSPFDQKDVLKNRHYRWNDGKNGLPKAWYLDVRETELATEKDWLIATAFSGTRGREVRVDKLRLKDRYSVRA